MDKINKDKNMMPAREVGVLIEDLRSQFRIFGEQLKAVEERLEGKIDGLDSKIDRLDGKIEGIATNQAKTLERITSIEITVRRIQADIVEIKEKFKGHDKRIAHLEESPLK